MGKNRCLVSLNDLVLFCSDCDTFFVIVMSDEPGQN